MKEIKYALFDVDGTLIDSMQYWQTGAAEYLMKKGKMEKLPDDINEKLKTLSIVEGVMLLAQSFPDLMQGFTFQSFHDIIGAHYERDASLRPGVPALLSHLASRGVRMAILTASFEDLVQKLFRRLGIDGYFEFIFTGKDFPKGKADPAIFRAALDRLSATPAETILFEDSLYSAETAHALGIRIAAIHDKCEPEWEKLRALSEIAFDDGVFTAEKIAEIVN